MEAQVGESQNSRGRSPDRQEVCHLRCLFCVGWVAALSKLEEKVCPELLPVCQFASFVGSSLQSMVRHYFHLLAQSVNVLFPECN